MKQSLCFLCHKWTKFFHHNFRFLWRDHFSKSCLLTFIIVTSSLHLVPSVHSWLSVIVFNCANTRPNKCHYKPRSSLSFFLVNSPFTSSVLCSDISLSFPPLITSTTEFLTPLRRPRSVVLGNNSDIFFHMFFPTSGCHNVGRHSRVLAGSLKT